MTAPHRRTEEFVTEVASTLASEVGVDAILLYGSVARGTARHDSDIDLLVVTERAISGRRLKADLADRLRETESLSISCRTWAGTAGLAYADWSFAAHLLREGQTLWDRRKRLSAALSSARPRQKDLLRQYDEIANRLRPFDDLSPYLGHYLLVLADVFRVGKAIAMLTCASAGIYEYDRRRAFATVADVVETAGGRAAEHLLRLEPFYLRAEGRSVELPWHPHEDADSVSEAVEAARALAAAGKSQVGKLAAA